MSDWRVEPLCDDFGARIRCGSLRPPLAVATVERILESIDRYSLLCFPDQPFDDAAQLAFTCCLGDPEPNHVKLGQSGIVDFFGTIGNVRADGTAADNADRVTVFQTGNNLWHSDSSFRRVPSRFSIMCAYEVPAEGGHTEFASARAAYARLPHELAARIDPLIAIHDYSYSRRKVSPDAVTPSHAASLPPVEQRLVRTNPRNGARSYYVGSHAREIVGLGFTDSRALLDDLLARATAPGHVYTQRWQPGDLVIWDNRCLLHRGTGYDADRYRRLMRQTRVRGAGPTLEE